MDIGLLKGVNPITDTVYQCKTEADLQEEYKRIFILCGGVLNELNFIRVGGIPLSPITLQVFTASGIKNVTYQDLVRSPERFMPKFDKSPENYSFALAKVENKPVFAGDVIFLRPHAVVYVAGSNSYDDPRVKLSPKSLKGRNEVTVLADSTPGELHISFDENSFLKHSLLGSAYQKQSLPVTGRVAEIFLTWKQWKQPGDYEEPHLIREQWEASKELGKELKNLALFVIGFLIVGSIIIYGIPAILLFLKLLLS